MKVFWAIGLFAGFAAVMAIGLVRAVHGDAWLLALSLTVFAGLFYGIGCTEP